MKRIFIAINLPEEVKNKLTDFQREIEDLFEVSPVRWTKKENLHITLAFLGNVRDEEIIKISQTVQRVGLDCQPFSIILNKVCYGPPKTMPPRMIWVEGEKNEKFKKLQASLERSLFGSQEEKSFALRQNEMGNPRRTFIPHITLGRIKQWQWRQIEPEERPEIDKEISLCFSTDSIEVMESKLGPGGPKYTILESVKLGQ